MTAEERAADYLRQWFDPANTPVVAVGALANVIRAAVQEAEAAAQQRYENLLRHQEAMQRQAVLAERQALAQQLDRATAQWPDNPLVRSVLRACAEDVRARPAP